MHLVLVVDLDQVLVDKVVVRAIRVVQRLYVVENLLDLGDVPCGADPQLFPRVLKAPGLDVLDLRDGVVSLLPPLESFIQKVEHSEIEAPHVIPPCQVH